MEEKTGLEGYYSIVNNKKMRFGYTTGSCATGAAKAAASMLFTGKEQKYVSFMTPKGILLHLEILHITRGDGWVSCAIKKDAGDDPDATNGIEIFAKVEKIKKKVNKSFSAYITELRMEEAMKLLSEREDIMVGQVAEIVGYSSHHYFCRVFKTYTGLSPLEYKNR